MKQFLYHGTCNLLPILKSKSLICNSFPEYEFEVNGKVLSLTRCFKFAKEYALQERDLPNNPAIFVFDRTILRNNYKLYIARSMIWGGYERHECEEFITEPIDLNHKSLINIIRLDR